MRAPRKIMEGGRAAAGGSRRGARPTLDPPCGRGAEETLDLSRRGGGRPPLHLFIHGGYWQRFYKQDFSHVAAGLVAHGVAVAVVNYSLGPGVGIGDIIGQMRRAAAFLWREAASLDVDVSQLQVSGHSAGGPLPAALVATDWPRIDAALPADMIRSGVPISGVFEIEQQRSIVIVDPLQ